MDDPIQVGKELDPNNEFFFSIQQYLVRLEADFNRTGQRLKDDL